MEQQGGSSSAAQQQTGAASGSSGVRMRKSAWSSEEDALLRAVVEQHGPQNWERISAAVPWRNAKSCRLRWRQHLDQTVVAGSTPFTADEDAVVVRLQRVFPNKWATIAGFLPGRTDNAVKNRWNSVLRKQQQQSAAAAAEEEEQHPVRPPHRHDGRTLELFPLKRGDLRVQDRQGPVLEHHVAPPPAESGQSGGACLHFFPLTPGDLVTRSNADAAPMDVDAGAGDPLTELKLGQFKATMVQAVRAP